MDTSQKEINIDIRRRIRQFLIFFSLVVWGCASPPVETTESGPVAVSNNQVLIATQKTKIIILTTGILDAWKPDAEGVDAMTSASVPSKSDKIAKIIVNKVLSIVEKNKNK